MRTPKHALMMVSVLAMAVPITGCALGKSKSNAFASTMDKGNIGVALRAQEAMEKGDHATAVRFAERAVENSPSDAGFRALLGNAYLAAGRFRSAEAAYRDALALFPNQAGIPLKLMLAQSGQGQTDAALATFDLFRGQIDAADAGLALALSGRPGAAVEMLSEAARQPRADARVRQNLALAHAIAGNWVQARSIAAQDLPGDQLEARMSEWAAFARPSAPGAQLASMIGVAAPSADPGVPVRLALKGRSHSNVAVAAADVAAPQVAAAPPPAPVMVAEAVPAAPSLVSAPSEPMPVLAAADPSPSVPVTEEPAPDLAEMVDSIRREPVRASGALPKVAELRRSAARRFGQSKAVVQLGAYATQQGVRSGWTTVSRRHASLRAYVPATARFNGPQGTVYRLSLKGFASDGEARSLCMRLKASGASCFVRNAAGDSPVRFASR